MIPNPKAYDSWVAWANSAVTVLSPFMNSVENTFFRQGRIAHVTTVSVSDLPSVGPPGRIVFCDDESGGAVLLFSDGTNWRRSTDRSNAS